MGYIITQQLNLISSVSAPPLSGGWKSRHGPPACAMLHGNAKLLFP